MRAVELAKVAAAAEALRVKRFARRQTYRVAYAGVAAVFLVCFLAMLHVLLVVLLAALVQVWLAVLIVLVADLVVAAVLGSIALRNTPDRVEREAAEIRRRSLSEARHAAASLATMGEVAGLALGFAGRRKARSSRVGRVWMIADLASRFIRR